MSQGGDVNVGKITWKELTKDKHRLEAMIESAIKAGEQQGVVLTAEEWESTIKRKIQNAVKLNQSKSVRQQDGASDHHGRLQGEEEEAT